MNLVTVSTGEKRGKAKIVKQKQKQKKQHPTLRRWWTVVLNMD